ncbi:unnamed protein product [Adineta ricciae]|uniref:Uncharacterized protein n=1 Tax=Adineta ricciae TaxID=249248 RepID=A0A815V4A6_ADIRI|nr:unnamed protein product [Adineta ricciae]
MSEGKLKVISADGQEFQIDHDIAKQSKLFRSYFDGEFFHTIDYYIVTQLFVLVKIQDDFDEPIKLAFTDASILKSVIDFCEHHKNDPEAEISDDDDDDDYDNNNIKIPKKDAQQLKQRKPVSEWDRAFIQRFSIRDGSLFDIIAAANYLDIPILLNTICKSVIYLIKGKTSAEIKEIFKLAEVLNETTTAST